MEINLDFDGTCVAHEYPNVGKDIGAIPVLKELIDNGHRLILFTMRSGMSGVSPVTEKVEDGGLEAAIQWFKDNNIPLYGIQTNPTQEKWTSSPKSYAHKMIDDSAIGCPLVYGKHERPYVDWIKVRELLVNEGIIIEKGV